MGVNETRGVAAIFQIHRRSVGALQRRRVYPFGDHAQAGQERASPGPREVAGVVADGAAMRGLEEPFDEQGIDEGMAGHDAQNG